MIRPLRRDAFQSVRRAPGCHSALLFLLVVLSTGPNPVAQEASPETNKKRTSFSRYSVKEGDQWKNSFKRSASLHSTFDFKDEGLGRGHVSDEEQAKITFMDALHSKTSVTAVTEDTFVSSVKILSLRLKLDSPMFQIDYDSDETTSGIYARIFGNLIDQTFTLTYNHRGQLKKAKGMRSILKQARNNLPKQMQGTSLEDLVQGLNRYLLKPIFLSFFEYHWVELPSSPITPEDQWQRRSHSHNMFIKVMSLFNNPNARLDKNLRVKTVRDNKVALRIIPRNAKLYNWTISSRKSSSSNTGTLSLSREAGTQHMKWNSRFSGGGDRRAETTIEFEREPWADKQR